MTQLAGRLPLGIENACIEETEKQNCKGHQARQCQFASRNAGSPGGGRRNIGKG